MGLDSVYPSEEAAPDGAGKLFGWGLQIFRAYGAVADQLNAPARQPARQDV
jgi:hypothetical protein